MTATLAASTAILKVRYPDGRLPVSCYRNTKYVATCAKDESDGSDSRVLAFQHEYPQGSSAVFATALGSLKQGTYSKFTLSRVEHFGIARIKGQALKAAEGDENALVDLWKNETDGASRTELLNHEIYSFGNGSGVLGRISSGQTTATITLTVASDAARFALGMRVGLVSTNDLSPTARTGYAAVTGVDRAAGTVTIGSNWNAAIIGAQANDYIVRAGDEASGGTAAVLTGLGGWVVGGSSPGTLFGLNRNTDPVRSAGQSYDATGMPIEEAVQEAEALSAQQGGMGDKTLWCHVRDFANLKKALGTKVTYPRTQVKGTMAGVSFSGVQVEGDDGTITIMTSPFISRNTAFLLPEDASILPSVGPAPHLQNYDKNDFLRVSGDDAQEVRFASYLQHAVRPGALGACVVLSNFGA